MELYSVERLDRMPDEELDSIIAGLLFEPRDFDDRDDYTISWSHEYRVQRWTKWFKPAPSCTPDRWMPKHPEFSSTYEGMARVIRKMLEKGFHFAITREGEVTFTNVDGQGFKYIGPAHEDMAPARFVVIAAILAIQATDKKSLAKWSLRGWLKGE